MDSTDPGANISKQSKDLNDLPQVIVDTDEALVPDQEAVQNRKRSNSLSMTRFQHYEDMLVPSQSTLIKPPQTVLIYCKPFDDEVLYSFQHLYQNLNENYKEIKIVCEKWMIDALMKQHKDEDPRNVPVIKEGTFPVLYENQDEESRKIIDFIITLGGDGTILWAAKQFHGNYVPPLISFAHGSLGYLCNFTFEDHKEVLAEIFSTQTMVNLDERMRLMISCPKQPVRDIYKGNDLHPSVKMNVNGYHVLNEVVIDRGPSPYAVQLEIYFDGIMMTTLVGDGLIISTPTGSTAYNLSAGGSIVQANTQCICVTPMAPHSLSFRPLIIPVSTTITIRKPIDNRSSAWVSLDGAQRFVLQDGDEFKIQGSAHSLKMVIGQTNNMMNLWSQRLINMLNWNRREQMKPLTKQMVSDASKLTNDK